MSVRNTTTYIRFTKGVDEASIQQLMNVIQQELSRGVNHFVILMSSPGGSVHWGVTAYTFLKGIPADVETHAFGRVNSVAIPIYCAGRRRYTTPNSSFMMHGVGFNVPANTRFDEKSLDERMKSLKNDINSIAKIIAENSVKSEEEIKDAMYVGTVLTTEQAVEYGLVHEVKEELFQRRARVLSI